MLKHNKVRIPNKFDFCLNGIFTLAAMASPVSANVTRKKKSILL